MSTLELVKMEEIFKMWRDNQKMAISGKSINTFNGKEKEEDKTLGLRMPK